MTMVWPYQEPCQYCRYRNSIKLLCIYVVPFSFPSTIPEYQEHSRKTLPTFRTPATRFHRVAGSEGTVVDEKIDFPTQGALRDIRHLHKIGSSAKTGP